MRNNNTVFFALFICWVFVQCGLLCHFGVFVKLESEKYLQQADLIIEGKNFSEAKYISYSLLIYLIVLAKILRIGIYGVYAIQLLLNLFSTLLLFRIIIKFSNRSIATILTAYF